MAGHSAFGIDAACAQCARIRALVVEARPRFRAIAVGDALGSTLDMRIAEIFGNTCARGSAIALLAKSIDAARTGRTGFRQFGDN